MKPREIKKTTDDKIKKSEKINLFSAKELIQVLKRTEKSFAIDIPIDYIITQLIDNKK